MTIMQSAKACWRGLVRNGVGQISLGSGSFEGAYSFPSRFESGAGTNPEELLAASHAACFSMAVASRLGKAGHVPESVHTIATVELEKSDDGFSIAKIVLKTEAVVDGMSKQDFEGLAEAAKISCPISKALAATKIEMYASLKSSAG